MKGIIEAPFVMSIEIEEGKVEKLNLFFDSNPEQIAYDFCREKNLDFAALKYLTREIEIVLKESQPSKNECIIKEDIKEISESEENISDEIRKNKTTTIEKNTIPTPKLTNQNNLNKIGLDKVNDSHNNTVPQKIHEKRRSFIPNNYIYNELPKSSIRKTHLNELKIETKYKLNIKDENISNNSISKSPKRSKSTNHYNTDRNINNMCHRPRDYDQTSNSLIKNMLSTSISSYKGCLTGYNLHKEEIRRKVKNKYDKNERYSFSPKINRSEEIVRNKTILMGINNKNGNTRKHNELYEHYKQKKELQVKRTEDFYKNYTFSPKINLYNFNLNFYCRQEIYKQMKIEKEKEIIKLYNNPIDNNTKQRLFSPQIFSRRTPNKNVLQLLNQRDRNRLNDYLYNYSEFFSMKKTHKTLSIHEEIKHKSNIKHTQNSSEKMFNRMKQRSFEQIFKALDKDEDGFISLQSISLKFIPNALKTILDPMIQKLKEEGCVINKKEFLEYCDLIYESSTKDKKKIILDYKFIPNDLKIQKRQSKNKRDSKLIELKNRIIKPCVNENDNIRKSNNI